MIEYRDMKPEEAKEARKLARRAFPFFYFLFIWGFKKGVVAVENGKIVGGTVRHEIKTRKGLFGYLDFGFTDKKSRGKGIGRETYTRSLSRLKEDGCAGSGAIVLCDNTASWGLLVDNGCIRSTLGSLIKKFGFLGAIKIWYETAFLFVPGVELWVTSEQPEKKSGSAAGITVFLLVNAFMAMHQGFLRGTGPDFITAGFVVCLLSLKLLFSWLPARSCVLPVKFTFWRSGLLIPLMVFLVGGVYPFGGDFYPAAKKWNYIKLKKQIGLIGLGSWISTLLAGLFLLYIKYLATDLLPMFNGCYRWIYMMLIFNSLPVLMESWPGSRVWKWHRGVFTVLFIVSILMLFLIFIK